MVVLYRMFFILPLSLDFLIWYSDLLIKSIPVFLTGCSLQLIKRINFVLFKYMSTAANYTFLEARLNGINVLVGR